MIILTTPAGKEPTLLAYDGDKPHQRQGRLGILLHDTSKWMMKKYIERLHRKMQPVIEHKMEKGWVNPAVGQLYEDITWVIALHERPEIRDKGWGFKGADDVNRKFYTQLRDVACVHLDEDTVQSMFAFILAAKMFDGWDEKYCDVAGKFNVMLRYREIYGEMKERTKKLASIEA